MKKIMAYKNFKIENDFYGAYIPIPKSSLKDLIKQLKALLIYAKK